VYKFAAAKTGASEAGWNAGCADSYAMIDNSSKITTYITKQKSGLDHHPVR